MSTSNIFRRVFWLRSGCRSSMFMRVPSDTIGWAKARARPHHSKILSAPCPPWTTPLALMPLVGTARERPCRSMRHCQRLCPPYKIPYSRYGLLEARIGRQRILSEYLPLQALRQAGRHGAFAIKLPVREIRGIKQEIIGAQLI